MQRSLASFWVPSPPLPTCAPPSRVVFTRPTKDPVGTRAGRVLIGDAKRQAETLKKEALLEAKEEIIKNKQAAEAEDKQRKSEIRTLENRVMQREESLDRRNDALDKREHQLSSQAGQVEKRSRELEELCAKQTSELERIADLTREDAHKELLDKVRGEVTHEAATIIRESEQQVRAECHKTAQEILSLAIQRCAADHTAEVTVTSVHIPSDDLKGRIMVARVATSAPLSRCPVSTS